MSSIEEKVYQKTHDAKKEESNDWYKFMMSVLIGFVITLIISLLGANFIYITSADNTILEKILPTDINSYFEKKQMGGAYTCNVQRNFKWPNMHHWPYSMRKSASASSGILQSFKNWIANTTAQTYIMNRELIKGWLKLFSQDEGGILANVPLQMFFIAPLTLSVAPLVYLGTLGSSFYNAFKENLGWGIAGFFLLFIWPILFTLSFVQLINYLFLFLLLPALMDLDGVKGILNCNLNSIFLLFGGFVCISSFLSLNKSIAIVSTIVYALMAIFSLL